MTLEWCRACVLSFLVALRDFIAGSTRACVLTCTYACTHTRIVPLYQLTRLRTNERTRCDTARCALSHISSRAYVHDSAFRGKCLVNRSLLDIPVLRDERSAASLVARGCVRPLYRSTRQCFRKRGLFWPPLLVAGASSIANKDPDRSIAPGRTRVCARARATASDCRIRSLAQVTIAVCVCSFFSLCRISHHRATTKSEGNSPRWCFHFASF